MCACIVCFVVHNFSSTNNLFNYRTTSKPPGNITDLDVSKSSQLSPTLTVSSNFEVHSPMVYYLCLLMVWLLGACAMTWFSILWVLHNMFVYFHTQLRESSPFFVYLERLLTGRLIILWHGLPIRYLWFEIFSPVKSRHVNLSTVCLGLGTSWHQRVLDDNGSNRVSFCVWFCFVFNLFQ